MTKEFWRAALIRAIRTMAQTAVAMIGTATVIGAVDWQMVISASILAGILSVLTSIGTGLPETIVEIPEGEEELDGEETENTEGLETEA